MIQCVQDCRKEFVDSSSLRRHQVGNTKVFSINIIYCSHQTIHTFTIFIRIISIDHHQDDYHNIPARPSTLGKKASSVESVEKHLQTGYLCKYTNLANN